MRLVEIEKYRHRSRKPLITLRQLNQEKLRLKNLCAAAERRKPLLSSMYGRDNSHEAQMQAVELEKEQVELAKEKAELTNIRAEQGTGTFQQIKKLSRSAMRARKK
ncbi:MAG: hypothetical protein JKY45_04055 [Emcibacter sp.]|nr:hypothetical protein [Emcibacter sp.]